MEAEIGVMHLQTKKCHGLSTTMRNKKKYMGWFLTHSFQKEPVLPNPWFQTPSFNNQLNQLWYSQETILKFTEETVVLLTRTSGRMACVTAPSIYQKQRRLFSIHLWVHQKNLHYVQRSLFSTIIIIHWIYPQKIAAGSVDIAKTDPP